MDLSKWKLEVYDLLAIILPGMIAIGEGWVLTRGGRAFCLAISHLTATGLTLLLLASFAAGTLIQELGDFAVKTCKGDRFFRTGRDKFWSSKKADPVKAAIKAHLGTAVEVDTAFDYCLTKLKGQFPKRDLFVATADLCRSFAVLSVIALAPTLREEYRTFGWGHDFIGWAVRSLILLVILFSLSWRRMTRFRELSDVTVFSAYLATVGDSDGSSETNGESTKEKVA